MTECGYSSAGFGSGSVRGLHGIIERISSRYPRFIIAILVALTLTGNLANAAGGYNERAAASVEARTVGEFNSGNRLTTEPEDHCVRC